MLFKIDEWGYLSAFALLMWVPVGLWLFSRERPVRAAAHTMIWGMMWLPEAAGFDLPVLPPITKYEIAALTALLGVWWKAPRRKRAARIGRGFDWWLWIMLAGVIGTVINNGEPLRYGQVKVTSLPAFLPYDGLYQVFKILFSVGIPCWLGRALLRTRQDLIDVLEILVVGGVVYSVPIFYELRMSPMLHADLYGFAARTDWLQNLRGGGYRATVFMGHGLVVSFFIFLSCVSAVTLRKMGMRRLMGLPSWAVVAYLFGMLLLCKSAGSFIYGCVAYALISWFSVKAQMRILTLIGLIVLSYPLTRMFDVFPVKGVLDTASVLGPDRVQSMQFRFDNEDILLLKGSEKLWFGWGGFGRDRVYDEYQGKDLVIQDGHWIVLFGQQGVVGFICFFALMLLPIRRAAKLIKNVRNKADRVALGGLCVMVTICSVNLLPNMSLPNLQLFLAMGLAVLVRELPKQAKQETKDLAQYLASQPIDAPIRPKGNRLARSLRVA